MKNMFLLMLLIYAVSENLGASHSKFSKEHYFLLYKKFAVQDFNKIIQDVAEEQKESWSRLFHAILDKDIDRVNQYSKPEFVNVASHPLAAEDCVSRANVSIMCTLLQNKFPILDQKNIPIISKIFFPDQKYGLHSFLKDVELIKEHIKRDVDLNRYDGQFRVNILHQMLAAWRGYETDKTVFLRKTIYCLLIAGAKVQEDQFVTDTLDPNWGYVKTMHKALLDYPMMKEAQKLADLSKEEKLQIIERLIAEVTP